MAKPGVLRRPVGSTGAFSEHAKLPRDLPAGTVADLDASGDVVLSVGGCVGCNPRAMFFTGGFDKM
jgi:hypothetical protein